MEKGNRSRLAPKGEANRDFRLHIISVEGKTEAEYFSKFPTNKRVRVAVTSPDEITNRSAPNWVVERADRILADYDVKPDDVLWLLFDCDTSIKARKRACQEAIQKGFTLALSNPCFELWLLLHLTDAESVYANCDAVNQHRVREFGKGQGKAFVDMDDYYPHLQAAIARAKALDAATLPTARWPAHPGTHVYKLVELLL